VLFDAYHPTLAGGTGERADWGIAEAFARDLPVMLAGGLNPDNVAEAIATVRPTGVDVSSGVERNGTKDPVLMRAFITRARAAFAQSTSSGTSSQDAP
jgi:phosphoribosylanthranilate isomerase